MGARAPIAEALSGIGRDARVGVPLTARAPYTQTKSQHRATDCASTLLAAWRPTSRKTNRQIQDLGVIHVLDFPVCLSRRAVGAKSTPPHRETDAAHRENSYLCGASVTPCLCVEI